MFTKDNIVTLESGEEILVLNDMIFAGRKFILGASVNTEKDEIDEDTLIVQEVLTVDGVEKLVPITDQAEAESFTKLLIAKEINEK